MNSFLVWMESLVVVSVLALVFIGVRLLWVRVFRKRYSPPAQLDEPLLRNSAIAVLVVMVLALVMHAFDLMAFIFLTLALECITYFLWDIYRSMHPLRVKNGSAKRAPVAKKNAAGKLVSPPPASPADQALPPKDYSLEGIDTLIIALILVFGIIRPLFLQTFFIPSGSMEPTLRAPVAGQHGGDMLIANKFVYRVHPPQRGDVVVFTPPEQAIVGNSIVYTTREWLLRNPDALTVQEAELLQKALVSRLRAEQDPGRLTDHLVTSQQDLINLLPAPPAHRDDYIKRVIGAPSDHILIVGRGSTSVVNGKTYTEGIYVNGTQLDEHQDAVSGEYYEGFHRINVDPDKPAAPSDFSIPNNNPVHFAAQPHLADFERLANSPHMRLSVDPGFDYQNAILDMLDFWREQQYLYNECIKPHLVNGEFIVPDDAIFVMGDNRTSTGSFDSRYWGVVPLKSVKARAVSTFFPFTRLKIL